MVEVPQLFKKRLLRRLNRRRHQFRDGLAIVVEVEPPTRSQWYSNPAGWRVWLKVVQPKPPQGKDLHLVALQEVADAATLNLITQTFAPESVTTLDIPRGSVPRSTARMAGRWARRTAKSVKKRRQRAFKVRRNRLRAGLPVGCVPA